MSNVKAYLEDIVRDGLHDIAEALKGGGPAGDVQASHVSYDNETSGLLGTNAQEAIDELSTKVNTNASGISDLTTRIGTAEGDITSLDGRLDTAEGDITSLDGRLDTAEEDITALETWKDNLDASDIPYGSGTVKDALDNMSAEGVAHNGIYRGKYLGNAVTAEQWAQIQNGTFEDLYIGDYWTINGVNWRIAHFDYWLHTGDTECTTHHVLIVPDSNLYTAKMNDSNVATGAYYGSAMRGGANYPSGGNLASAVTTATSAFGASHLLSHRALLTNAISGNNASNWAWYDSSVELMSEVQVYGFPAWSVGGKGYEVGIDKEQLALFKLDHSKITNRSGWWLRSVASSAYFCRVNSTGLAIYDGASASLGVRPVFAII